MRTVTDYYATLGTVATDAEARAVLTPPDDDAARAELMTICEACTSREIAAALERLATLDGNYRDSRFVGIVATLRSDWTGLPARGPLFEYEWYWLWPGGEGEKRAQYGEWLMEALGAARVKEGTS